MGPCTANARRSTVVSRCRGTTISCCVADLRRCLPNVFWPMLVHFTDTRAWPAEHQTYGYPPNRIVLPLPVGRYLFPLGNESVPIQLAQCRFPGLAIFNAKM